MNHFLPPPSLPHPLHVCVLCVFVCMYVCMYVHSPGIYKVLQECGDKAKAVAVRHSIVMQLCKTVCRYTDVHTYFIKRK